MKNYHKENNYYLIMLDTPHHNRKTFLVLILKNFNQILRKKNFWNHKNYSKIQKIHKIMLVMLMKLNKSFRF